ncbi:MAG: NnrU family protein [Alphaproteobacteria bacterium HGW-Alphaproteobacteria-2]|nr:MAG: NnrU family protein [Alphaproteobacteria bacterium HGW-Alphaproteobacteria-2]
MTGWSEYAAAWAVFLASHALPVRPPLRPWLVARLGARGFTLAYSALSIALLAWLIGGAGRAPYLALWQPAPWQTLAAQAAMLAACLVLALALGRPNPLSFGGARDAAFDPDRPGIAGWIRHPVLAVLALWAAGHLAANGDLAHALMFGGFCAFALLGMRMIDFRRRRELGDADWVRLARGRGHLPPGWPWRLAAGAALWLALGLAHPHVIGPVVLP